MTMTGGDLALYRQSAAEQKRIGDLLKLLPKHGAKVLDVGARDGYISILLTQVFDTVTALDLQMPQIDHPKVNCVKGNITALEFPDNYFDAVLCAEVLEHLPPTMLATACAELWRVAKNLVVIGVPYKQDTRVGRTTCYTCGEKNPPWGHLNEFDENRLRTLFPELSDETTTYIGATSENTNAISSYFMDLAGNPYGTYGQDESCVHCGAKLKPPPARSFAQKVFTKIAVLAKAAGSNASSVHANWIHIAFRKRPAAP